MFKSLKKIINSLENSKIPFIYFILTFIFVVSLRNFIELFSDSDTSQISFAEFFHYDVSYIALAMVIIILLYFFIKKDVLKIARVVLTSFLILLIVPIIDLIWSFGKGLNMAYMLPGYHSNIMQRFFTFFGDFSGLGITPGIRVEIIIVLLGVFFYIYINSSRIVKSLLGVLFAYPIYFFYLAAPFLAKGLLEIFGLTYKYSDSLMTSFFLLVILFAGIFIAYISNKKYFRLIIKDIRPFRLLHFELMFFIGFIIGFNKFGTFVLDSTNIFSFIFIPAGIAFAWLYSVITNNIVDYDIDKISNNNRPLIESKIDKGIYCRLSWIILFIALFYPLMVSFKVFFMILLFIGNYFLYSMPPLRLKRIPLFSKMIIAFNSLILVMLGFIISTGKLEGFPVILIAFFLIGFTLVINFIDIKDYEGDKKAGIKTLPVILGLKKSKFIIGLFFLLTYLGSYLLIKNLYLIPVLFTFGITEFLLINRKNYNEKPVFFVYLLSLALFIMYLIIFKII
ncbi:MAG: UbiA family prenyltransferase [Nanoarchaeota archaeon]|nr:UbiA family prenyltransferase [Nanoarchaeota archaeon]